MPGRALVVVDVQNDFCEGGSLAVKDGAQVAADVHEYIRDHGGGYDVVVATKDWHLDPGDHWSESPDYVDTWPQHCRAGRRGSDFHPALDIAFNPRTHIFYKGLTSAAYSGFEGTNDQDETLDRFLKDKGISEVDAVGIAFDYCVKATAVDAARLGYATQVLLHLTASVAPDNDEATVEALHEAGVEVVA